MVTPGKSVAQVWDLQSLGNITFNLNFVFLLLNLLFLVNIAAVIKVDCAKGTWIVLTNFWNLSFLVFFNECSLLFIVSSLIKSQFKD